MSSMDPAHEQAMSEKPRLSPFYSTREMGLVPSKAAMRFSTACTDSHALSKAQVCVLDPRHKQGQIYTHHT